MATAPRSLASSRPSAASRSLASGASSSSSKARIAAVHAALAPVSPRSSAQAKVTEAALAHDRERDGPSLRAFQGAQFDEKAFRTQWNKAFPYSTLTRGEAAACFGDFDRDGSGAVNGAELIVEFYRRKAAGKRNGDRRRLGEADALRGKAKSAEARRSALERGRLFDAANQDFKARDAASAKAKLVEASLEYLASGSRAAAAVHLAGFTGAGMEPATLREQLRRAFGLRLTAKELGAVVALVDGGSGVVDGSTFLRYFFKVGNDAQKSINERAFEAKAYDGFVADCAEMHRRDAEELSRNVAADVGFFDRRDADAALYKIQSAAATDRRSPPALAPLREPALTPVSDFASRLRATLEIGLTAREANAAVATLQEQACGRGGEEDVSHVDTDRFVRDWLQMKARSSRAPRTLRPRIDGKWTKDTLWRERARTAPTRGRAA
ncbi:hypothetical protein M885DRAFT_510092 [Pelagophyceae sp. CCMP2097]|nr:hypothetical protein M885DRAFT_510092 [Pelagophyceae sp. CCMP2097]